MTKRKFKEYQTVDSSEIQEDSFVKFRNISLDEILEHTPGVDGNPSAEEAADIMEIFHFICHRLGIKDSEIMAQTTSKRIARGAFEMGYILEWVED